MTIPLSNFLSQTKEQLLENISQCQKRKLNVIKDKISCKPKCSYCCSRYLTITVAEASILFDQLKKSGLWEDVKKKCEESKEIVLNTNPISYFKMNMKCPVLKDDLCSAYHVRPIECATHHVSSNPEGCDPLALKNETYIPVNFTDIYTNFHNELDNLIDGFGIFALRLPIQIALLLSEKISETRDLDSDSFRQLLHSELA